MPKIHFPARSPPPALDPNAPDFLQALHEKYYPDLPADPSKLSWMAPLTAEEVDDDDDDDGEDDKDGSGSGSGSTRPPPPPTSSSSPYSPRLAALPPSAIRFDFRGALLPPRTARAVPVSAGLHHHGDAPEAAGYTIPELARLARSSFPAQRCIAYQTLGRILYRLGTGRFGAADSDLAQGLWRCVRDGRVLESLQQEAALADHEGSGGHASAKALAVEALWNWQRGGGKQGGSE
jgi:hypothetical protein